MDKDKRKLTEKELKRKDFETYTATGVQEAIDILKQNAIDLICSDWI